MSGELVNYDLTQYLDKNLLLPKIISGPNVFVTQRTEDFSISSLGGITNTVKIPKFNGWLKNIIIRVELSALSSSSSGTGYHNWVDNLGHALIEYIQLKVGNTTLFDSDFPYGLWLDIYNELNDPDMLEWSLIGKHSSIDGLKKYETGKKILYIPLHLWFSKNINNMLPYFLFGNEQDGISISIKTRSIEELVLKSASQTNNNVTIDMKLIYETVESREDNNIIEIFQNIYRAMPYQIYFDLPINVSKTTSTTTNLDFSDEIPIKKIVFTIQNNDRITQDSTPLINENYSDTNGNDWFNYGNNTIITDLNTTDTFNKLIIKLDNTSKDPVELELDAIYYRKMTNLQYNLNLPQKHIYTIPFSYDYRENSILGFYNYKIESKITLQFTEPASNSTINAFAISTNKLEIYNGKVNINAWMQNTDLISKQATLTSLEQSEDTKTEVISTIVSAIQDVVKSRDDKKLLVCKSILTQNSAIKIRAMSKNKLFLLLNVIEEVGSYNFIILMPINKNIEKTNVNNSSETISESYKQKLINFEDTKKYLVFNEIDNTKLFKINKDTINSVSINDTDYNMIKLIIKLLVLDKKLIIGDYLEHLIKNYISDEDISTTISPSTTSGTTQEFDPLKACPEDLVETKIPDDTSDEENTKIKTQNTTIKNNRKILYNALDEIVNVKVDNNKKSIKNRIFKIKITENEMYDLWKSSTTMSDTTLNIFMNQKINEENNKSNTTLQPNKDYNKLFLTNDLKNSLDSNKLGEDINYTLTDIFSASRYLYVDNKKNIYESNTMSLKINLSKKHIKNFVPENNTITPYIFEPELPLNADKIYYITDLLKTIKTKYRDNYAEVINKKSNKSTTNSPSNIQNLQTLRNNITELREYITFFKKNKSNKEVPITTSNNTIYDKIKNLRDNLIYNLTEKKKKLNYNIAITNLKPLLKIHNKTLVTERDYSNNEPTDIVFNTESKNYILAIEIEDKKVILHTINKNKYSNLGKRFNAAGQEINAAGQEINKDQVIASNAIGIATGQQTLPMM